MSAIHTGFPELVEGLFFFFRPVKEGTGFDKLSQAGVFCA